MATIAKDRKIETKLFIGRPDGTTYEEVSDNLVNAEVELGDVSSVGTGNTGADAVVRTCRFTLQNDEDTDFSPRNQNSSINQFDVDGDGSDEYAPLLYPMREAILQVRILELEGKRQIFEGDGSTATFYFDNTPIEYGSEQILQSGFGYTWEDYPSTTWDELSNQTWDDITVKQETTAPGYTINYDTGEITFNSPLQDGELVYFQYVHITSDTGFVDIFGGYLGDSISTSGQTVSCDARDYAKELQQTYIEDKRVYGNSDGSVLAEDVIQSILNDNGLSNVDFVYPQSSGFAIRPYELQYKSVWDAIQEIVNQFGWFLGYKFNGDKWQLMMIEPPRNKDTNGADYILDYEDDFYKQDLDLDDADIRNAIKVTYRDKDFGAINSITKQDGESINAFGRRVMQIEEENSSQIDTQEEANAMAGAALSDLKDLPVSSNIDMPLFPKINLFDGINIINDLVSSTKDFYAVNSIRHKLDFSQGSFRTEVQCEGKVVGGKAKWLKMQTRPGASKPTEKKNLKGRNATVVIAASNTDTSVKEQADYVCDGLADQEQINQAFSDLIIGGKVILLEGDYYINGLIDADGKYILESNESNIIVDSSIDSNNTLDYAIKMNNGFKLRNVTFDCESSYNNLSGIKILDNGDNCKIDNVEVKNYNKYGITAGLPKNILISNCYIHDNLRGISPPFEDYIISKNTISNNTIEGMLLQITGEGIISNNLIAYNGEEGVLAYDFESVVSDINLQNNTIKYNGRGGIIFDPNTSVYNANIKNNKLIGNSQETDNAYANINLGKAFDCDIQNNFCRIGDRTNKTRYGIEVQSDCDNNIVANNDLYNSGQTANLLDNGTGTETLGGNRT